jgi:Universal stress protein family
MLNTVIVGVDGLQGAMRRVVLASSSDRLIHQASCPVIVVPRSAVAHEAAAAQHELAHAKD